MMLSYKTYSTPLSTSDTLADVRVTLDSVKKLVPRGYYILTEQGAKKSLKAAIDARAFEQKFIIADTELGNMAVTVGTLTVRLRQSEAENRIKTEVIKGLQKKLMWQTVWKYLAMAAGAAATTQLIFR